MATTTMKATITPNTGSPVEIVLLNPKCIKHQFDKMLQVIPVPEKTGDKLTFLIDIGRLKEVISITGVLLDEEGSSARKKKEDLVAILETPGTMKLSWDVNSTGSLKEYTVNIIKAEITESAGNFGDLNDTKFFDIQIQFGRGLHKG